MRTYTYISPVIWKFVPIALLVFCCLLLPGSAIAGEGSLTAGAMELFVNYQYPPSTEEMDQLQDHFRMASRILCDASEGQVRIKDVTISAGANIDERADIFIYPEWGRSGASGGGIAIFPNNLDVTGGGLIAHELIHYMFSVADSYAERRRWGGACGIGLGVESALLTERQSTLGQNTPRLTCQYESSRDGQWRDFPPGSTKYCIKDTDCCATPTNCTPSVDYDDPSDRINDETRCYFAIYSELANSATPKYYDTVWGMDDVTDCPDPRATSKVFVVPPLAPGAADIQKVILKGETAGGPNEPTNTDNFVGKTYAEAEAASIFSQQVEVFDGAGLFSAKYNRSSHQLMLYWQKRQVAPDGTQTWRVWIGVDSNKALKQNLWVI
jgi:hypothetical protein